VTVTFLAAVPTLELVAVPLDAPLVDERRTFDCPLCEATDALAVDRDAGRAFCFACGASGAVEDA
jgi:hypothetical protein